MRAFAFFLSRRAGRVEDLSVHRGNGIANACETAGEILHGNPPYERVQIVEYADDIRAEIVSFGRSALQERPQA